MLKNFLGNVSVTRMVMPDIYYTYGSGGNSGGGGGTNLNGDDDFAPNT